jgi:tRNA pseudouridine55 synthase
MAEGVLPIFVGNATKAVDYCPDNTKEYRAGIRFGVTTDTQDFTGKVLTTCDTVVEESAKELLKKKFTGELMQTPPMYSAVQIDGQRLYDLARKGIEVEREPRKINVYSLEFEEFGDNVATVLVSCSKGTYIRTLIHDMGVELGTGAIMTSLTRTRSGNFTLRDCYRLSEVRENSEVGGKDAVEKMLMPLDIVFRALPAARLNETQTRMFKNGVVLDIERVNLDRDEGPYRIQSSDGDTIAIGNKGKDGDLEVIQRFFGGENEPSAKKEEKAVEQEAPPPDSHLKDVSTLKGVML